MVFLSAAMVELDGDDIRISSRGKLAERDIVQVRYAAVIIAIYICVMSGTCLGLSLKTHLSSWVPF